MAFDQPRENRMVLVVEGSGVGLSITDQRGGGEVLFELFHIDSLIVPVGNCFD